MSLQLQQGAGLCGRCASNSRTPRPLRAATRPDLPTQDGFDAGGLAKALAAVAAVAALTGRVAAARAEDDAGWKPRRHYRHIGERITDTWADAVVEVQEADKQLIRDLQRQLRLEQQRADDEAARRQAAEQRARAAVMQQVCLVCAWLTLSWLILRLPSCKLILNTSHTHQTHTHPTHTHPQT